VYVCSSIDALTQAALRFIFLSTVPGRQRAGACMYINPLPSPSLMNITKNSISFADYEVGMVGGDFLRHNEQYEEK
jgi:hypothetical protein